MQHPPKPKLNKKQKAEFNNRFRLAMRKMWTFRRQIGIPTHGLKMKTLIYMYSEHIGQPIPMPIGANYKQWLIDLYDSGKDKIVCRVDAGFYLSPPWQKLRKEVIEKYGYNCMKCGSDEFTHVDHILPRSKYPSLELEFDNMQILCRSCNCSKSNRATVDYRPQITNTP